LVQSEPHSHTEYVNFEASQHTGINKLEDFHTVRADKSDSLEKLDRNKEVRNKEVIDWCEYIYIKITK